MLKDSAFTAKTFREHLDTVCQQEDLGVGVRMSPKIVQEA